MQYTVTNTIGSVSWRILNRVWSPSHPVGDYDLQSLFENCKGDELCGASIGCCAAMNTLFVVLTLRLAARNPQIVADALTGTPLCGAGDPTVAFWAISGAYGHRCQTTFGPIEIGP